MNKHQEYANHSSSIAAIYENLGIQLQLTDKKWLDEIFSLTAVLDDLIDSGDPNIGKAVLELLKSGTAHNSLSFQYENEVLNLRNHLLNFSDGEDRLNTFIRTLRILFRQTNKISKTRNISTYFRYSILEGRAFGRMVSLGIEDKRYGRIIMQAGGMENLTDDILDINKDFLSGERKMHPSVQFYIQGIGFTVGEILNMNNKFGFKQSFHAIRASISAMWKKYVLNQVFE